MSVGWSGPDPVAVDDGAQGYELGTKYLANGDVTINKFRVWQGATSFNVVGRKGRLWTSAGAFITDAFLADSLPSGWSVYNLAAPQPMPNGTQFWVTYNTFRYYGAVAGGYPRPSGDTLLTAQGGAFNATQGLFPTNNTASFYGVDVDYAAGIGGNVAPILADLKVSPAGTNATATWTVVDEAPGTVSYRVEWGDGTFTNTTALTATHTYTTTGAFAVMVIATDAGGLTDSAAAVVEIIGLSSAELSINRLNTKAFIYANPIQLELIPVINVRTETGGRRAEDGPKRAAQVLRLIEQASAYGNTPGLLPSQDGQQRRVTYQLLGEFDSVIAVGDHWLDANGVRYEVRELLPYNGYERRGRVVQYG